MAKGKSGTRVRFWPDRQIFTKDATFVFDELITRARQTSFIVPGLELVIRDLRGSEPREEKFRHDGGIAEFTEFLAADEPVTEILRLQGMDTFTETVPLLDDKGHMTPQEIERELHVDVAVRWGTGYDTEVRSFVNVIATPKGGTHVGGFEQAVTKTFNEVMRQQGAQGQRPRRDQGRRPRGADRGGHGAPGRAAVRGPDQGDPRHAGRAQRRTPGRLGELKNFLTSGKRGDKAQAKLVMDKVVGAQHAHRRAAAQGDPAPEERA